MIEATGRGEERFVVFDPQGPPGGWQVQLRAPVRLVRRPDGQLGQLAVPADGVPRLVTSSTVIPHPPGTRYDGTVPVIDAGTDAGTAAGTGAGTDDGVLGGFARQAGGRAGGFSRARG